VSNNLILILKQNSWLRGFQNQDHFEVGTYEKINLSIIVARKSNFVVHYLLKPLGFELTTLSWVLSRNKVLQSKTLSFLVRF